MRFDLGKIFKLIIKRLKKGCQWRELSIKEYFSTETIIWQLIYYYFNKLSKDGSFKRIWISLLQNNKRKLDLSCIQLDRSHPQQNMTSPRYMEPSKLEKFVFSDCY